MGTQKRVRISHGKRAIGVRAIEVRLNDYKVQFLNTEIYFCFSSVGIIEFRLMLNHVVYLKTDVKSCTKMKMNTLIVFEHEKILS